jgi:predicted acyl esterase
VTFLTAPMTRDTEITGPVAAKLWLSSDSTDADVFVVLRVLDPAGKEVVRPWHTHDEEWPLTPGLVVELDIEIWPTSIVAPTGYRVGLTVRGKDYEYDGTDARVAHAPYPMKGVGPFTLHFAPGKMPYLLLPIIPLK